MRLYTISNGIVTEGATVEELHIESANIDIPAIIVGESGRGRSRGVIPVQLSGGLYSEWNTNKKVTILDAKLGETKKGKPKLFTGTNEYVDDILVVFRTPIGYRGSNSHTGDRVGYVCSECNKIIETDEALKECPICGYKSAWDYAVTLKFHPFPGKIISEGTIAQGDAGRMGSGDQIVAIIKPNIVFRTGYSGRLYGGHAAHYYNWDGDKLIGLTWDDRVVSDLF